MEVRTMTDKEAYKPYAEFLKKYESLFGRQKQSYYDRNVDKIETALSYRIGLKNMSGTEKLLPKTWKKELAEIADKAAMVQRGKTE